MGEPKNPVKPTAEKIADAAAKRANKNRTEYLGVPSGDIANLLKVADDFAKNQGVTLADVKIVNGWKTSMYIKRPETDAEKLARVKAEYMDRYNDSMYNYRAKMRQYEEDLRRASYIQGVSKTCCPSNCCCRRNKTC
jgi:hypothetical protein